ncbi:MAG: FAD-binding oxidoreductase [Pseudomonadota bacterium]
MGPSGPSLDGVELVAPSTSDTTLNDASRLSETPIHKRTILTDDPGEALVSALRDELRAARSANRPVICSAARHSMGGQSIPRAGHAVSFDTAWVQPGAMRYRVHAGARWRDVIAALDPVGLAPKVMQANNDFGIAATFSVNAHGWATAFGPMGSTVTAIKVLLADGRHVTASRAENAEIFAAAMGGYGLIGVITELDLEAAANVLYQSDFETMDAPTFGARFAETARQFPMTYGRLNIDRGQFFSDALLVTYRPTGGDLPALDDTGSTVAAVSRGIFRSQTNNEWVKRRRWGLETGLGPLISGPVSRSQLMNDPVSKVLSQTDLRRTDILHEYFVAPERFDEFLTVCRAIIPNSYQELLNVTLRWVEQDPLSVLSYAPDGPRIAAVLSFSQEMSARAEADMTAMTRRLIDAVHEIGGSYYLPYRPHATLGQFRAGYKGAEAFAALKRRLDPDLLFRNALWDRYLSAL